MKYLMITTVMLKACQVSISNSMDCFQKASWSNTGLVSMILLQAVIYRNQFRDRHFRKRDATPWNHACWVNLWWRTVSSRVLRSSPRGLNLNILNSLPSLHILMLFSHLHQSTTFSLSWDLSILNSLCTHCFRHVHPSHHFHHFLLHDRNYI
jgi:hypothetical protein